MDYSKVVKRSNKATFLKEFFTFCKTHAWEVLTGGNSERTDEYEEEWRKRASVGVRAGVREGGRELGEWGEVTKTV